MELASLDTLQFDVMKSFVILVVIFSSNLIYGQSIVNPDKVWHTVRSQWMGGNNWVSIIVRCLKKLVPRGTSMREIKSWNLKLEFLFKPFLIDLKVSLTNGSSSLESYFRRSSLKSAYSLLQLSATFSPDIKAFSLAGKETSPSACFIGSSNFPG